MSFEEQQEGVGDNPKTARTVGQLVKYSREVNQSRTVGEVGTYALEATFHVMDGHPSPTVSEARDGELRVLESMRPDLETGGEPDRFSRLAYERRTTVVNAPEGTEIAPSSDDLLVERDGDADVTIAAPSVNQEGLGVILAVSWTSLDSIEQHHVKPLEYLADHVATAVNNIRSRERLERARNDLETRKEMIEMYDRLLRHDLGNDLQVIAGFSDVMARQVDGDGPAAEHASKIQRTAESAADLVERVGDLVKTLEQEEEPVVRDLEPILTPVVADVAAKFSDLTVEYDPGDFDYQVYTGDLLDSVFTNLLSNAAVHNDEPVTVRIYAEEPSPNRIVVGIADDGSGVAGEVRDEIFEMGKKGPESDGSGFGLGFVRALTQSYGGTVEVRESDRGGADFRISLERP
jgi:signal transduction histidine kinase